MTNVNSGEVITSLEQVTTAWLTSVLSRSGALAHGAVNSFDLDAGQGNWSTSGKLTIHYTGGAEGALPRRLFLKLVDAAQDDEFFGDSEVTYYTRDYVDVEKAPLLRCYDAVYSQERRRYHLLLEDVSPTHVIAREKEPELEFGLALAEALAILHARWWGPERLAEAGAPIHSASHIREFVAIAEPGVGHIVGRFSDQLQPHWPDLMRDLFARHPAVLTRRSSDPNGFTLIHGDVGRTNILIPRHDHRPLYIIDRQPFEWSLTTWLGVYDLAYAIVLDWETEARRRWELPLLERYHVQLIENGVRDYSWQQLLDDFRLCAAMGVYVAVEYCRGGVNERQLRYWLPKLQRSLAACDDWDCRALW